MAIAPNTTVKKLFVWQVVVILILMGLFAIKGVAALVSVLVGSLLAAIPTLIFTRNAFRFGGAKQAKLVLRSFYLGEALKLISCSLGFALVFMYASKIDMAALWASFCLQLILPMILAAKGVLKPSITNTSVRT